MRFSTIRRVSLTALLLASAAAAGAPSRAELARFSVVTTEGDSVASARITMPLSTLPQLLANADYMSVGPRGPTVMDTTSGPGFRFENPVFRRLRVTLCSSENAAYLIVDDIVTGRADSRIVNASYLVDPFGAPELWAALRRAPRVSGPDPGGPPITWLSPTSFEWVTRADTLVYEQLADSNFRVTVRARVR